MRKRRKLLFQRRSDLAMKEISKHGGTGNRRNHSEYLVSKNCELCVCTGSQCWIPQTVRWSFVAWLRTVVGEKPISVFACAETEVAMVSDQPTSDFCLCVHRNWSGGGWWSTNKWFPSLRAQKRKRSVTNLSVTSERGIASRYRSRLACIFVRTLKQIDSILPCFCPMIKSKITSNVVRTKKCLKRRSRVRNWF